VGSSNRHILILNNLLCEMIQALQKKRRKGLSFSLLQPVSFAVIADMNHIPCNFAALKYHDGIDFSVEPQNGHSRKTRKSQISQPAS